MANQSTNQAIKQTATLSCKGLWKLFGDNSQQFLEKHSSKQQGRTPSHEDILNAGLIAAVQNANFDIYPGEIFVIMGLSGSGKSTLVRCLSRLVEPTAGEVLFNGEDLLGMSDKKLIDVRRHKMGMVFQHFALLPHLNVLENVAFPLSVQGISKTQRETRALEVIKLVGLEGREAYYPNELSGGQQQRVGIARSLAVEPEVWFLDEPFSALDPLIRREMQDEFLRLQSVLKKTIVFITHDFDEAIRLADRIAIMQDGAIVQIGSPEELVLNPATDYVAEFTQEISRAKVLTAKSIMSPIAETQTDQSVSSFVNSVNADARIQDFAADVVHDTSTIAVVDSTGILVGTLKPKTIIDVLVSASSDKAAD